MQKLLLASSVVAGVSAAQVNPIRRVVTLLQDMQKEIEADGDKEQKLFEKFMCFCKGGTKNMSQAADDASAQISELTAQLEANTAQKAQLTQDLVQHKQDRADAKQDLATATAIRTKEHKQYVEDSGETKSHIDALSAAIPAIEKGMGSFLQTTAAASLKNLVSAMDSSLDNEDKEAVMSFLEQKGDYIPASGQIVGILKNMKDEMDKSLGGIVSDEEAAAKSFSELKAAKEKEIAANSENIEKKTVRAGELAVKISEGKAAIKNATDELDDAQKFKANLKAQCAEKETDWAERSKTRTQEVAAIGEAIAVLNNDDALDIFNKSNTKALVQNSFLQTGAQKNRLIAKAKVIVQSLDTKGNTAVSLMQHTVMAQLKSKKMDFSKVLKMIDDMVVLLKKEQSSDEKHRDWCNAEFDSSADAKKAAENSITGHNSAVADLEDEIATLKAQIAKAEAAIADLDKSVSESTAQRKEENADYVEARGLNDAARKLIFKAKNRLNKFYNPNQHIKKQRRELTPEDRSRSTTVASTRVMPRRLPSSSRAPRSRPSSSCTTRTVSPRRTAVMSSSTWPSPRTVRVTPSSPSWTCSAVT